MQEHHFGRSHNTCELQELQPAQEVLFLSPMEQECIPGPVNDKANMLHSYIVKVQYVMVQYVMSPVRV